MTLEETISNLMFEDESTSLDFKRDQYIFEKENIEEKSELLKDILAFANAWRRTDAFILIGVDENKGGIPLLVGVQKHLNDSDLQQFVNSKTNRPIDFLYHSIKIDDLDLGVIRIPIQERPFFVKKDFGKVKKETVYIRRGSSTAIATPDEISKMGVVQSNYFTEIPLLDVQFYDAEQISSLGKEISLTTLNVRTPDDNEIPNYGSMSFPIGPNINTIYMNNPTSNKEYYRDMARFLKEIKKLEEINFIVSNNGNVLAKDVQLKIEIIDPENSLYLLDKDDIPVEPKKDFISKLTASAIASQNQKIPDIRVQYNSNKYIIEANFGKIQAKNCSYTRSGLFIGAGTGKKIRLECLIYADNLRSPIECILDLNIGTEEYDLKLDKLIKICD